MLKQMVLGGMNVREKNTGNATEDGRSMGFQS